MYLTSEENKQMISVIHDNFDNATVLMECLAKKWVNKEKVEESIQKTGAKFVFGADSFEDIKDIARGFRKVSDDDIRRGMTKLYPMLKPFVWVPYVKKIMQKILVFEKI